MFPLVRHASLHLVNSLISKLLHELWQNRARVSPEKPLYLRRTEKGKLSESIERSHFCPIQAVKQTAECPSWLFFVVPLNMLGSIHPSRANLQDVKIYFPPRFPDLLSKLLLLALSIETSKLTKTFSHELQKGFPWKGTISPPALLLILSGLASPMDWKGLM